MTESGASAVDGSPGIKHLASKTATPSPLRVYGAEGEVIITQLLGFLLAALAVEIGSAGIKELFLS